MTAEPRHLRVLGDEDPAVVDVTEATTARLSSGQAGPHLTDAVVAAAKRGEDAAWEAVFATHGPRLKGFLTVLLRDRDDATEALSETFFRAYQRIESLRAETASGFRAWLYRIARNVALDQMRAKRRVVCVADPADAADLLLDGFDDAVIGADDAAAVRRAFAELDADDREILALRIVAGLPSHEVGRIVGKRPGTVRMQQQRALTTLGRKLDL